MFNIRVSKQKLILKLVDAILLPKHLLFFCCSFVEVAAI